MTPDSAAPVSLRERLEYLDVIRGSALLGVLLMNIHFWFRTPYERYALSPHPWPGFVNVFTDNALAMFMEAKAMTLFSMLFAVGLAIQLERIDAQGIPFARFAWRRLGVLLGLGILHIVLLWMGDILHMYALGGMLLLAFLRRKLRTVVIWVCCLWGLAALGVLTAVAFQIVKPHAEGPRPEHLQALRAWIDQAVSVYGHGTWGQILVFRLRDYLRVLPQFIGGFVLAFLNFMVGLALWKGGLLRDPSAHLPLLRKACAGFLSAGLVLGIFLAVPRPITHWAIAHGVWGRLLFVPLGLSQVLQPMVLALGYGSGLLLLWQKARWRTWIRNLAPVGRMALSNYLLQSLAMTALYYHWGLGLYDKLGPAAGAGLGIAFFALQIPLSRWWLERFHFGPVEWLWRCLSYAKIQPFRIRESFGALPELG